MLRSMTGFGNANRQAAGLMIQLDMKSVNHRHCDIVVKMPREWLQTEDRIKKEIQKRIQRGRIEIYISISTTLVEDQGSQAVQINWPLAQSYVNAAEQLKQKFNLAGQVSLQDLLNAPHIVVVQDQKDEMKDLVEEAIYQCVTEAVERLITMRETEGRYLQQDLQGRMEQVLHIHRELSKLAPEAVREQQLKFRARIAELLDDTIELDDNRLAMETAIMADRMNIDEELTRLASHCEQFSQLLNSTEPVGRRMDFLLQEMNREANTIGSKSNHVQMQNLVIELKAELEKLREQVQNIE